MNSLLQFIRMESFAGILLIFASIIALILANSPWARFYQFVIEAKISIGINNIALSKPFLLWINDGLMALFFLLIGLEVKREILEGDLSNWSQIALPAIAALGGIIAPVLIYTAVNHQDSIALTGWAIAGATDIAFALGVLALLGSRIPASLKIFLMTLAIFDDLAVIIIIAIYYSTELSVTALILALFIITLLILLNRWKIGNLSIYLFLGLLLWLCLLKSGVHATLAGVILAFTIPLNTNNLKNDSPLKKLENSLHDWVTYCILPLFAFANAGISLQGFSIETLLKPVSLGILFGLFFGKQLGVFLFSYIAIKSNIATLPTNARWQQLYGVAVLCGIGFTMSFFISSLTFEETHGFLEYSRLSRIAILLGSLLSAIVGYLILRFAPTNIVENAKG